MRLFLFPRLTRRQPRGSALFDALVAEARQPRWFLEGDVPDTLDGRFALLATVLALAIVRLEAGNEDSQAAAVALTERFVHAMDAEHRQLGLGDPTVGKHVRKLVTALGRRVEQWRQVVEGGESWEAAATASVYRGAPPRAGLDTAVADLQALWARIQSAPDTELAEGRIG